MFSAHWWCVRVVGQTATQPFPSSLRHPLVPGLSFSCLPLQDPFLLPGPSFLPTVFFKVFIGVQLLYSVVFLAVQQSESVTCIHISPLFQISFPFRPPQSTEQISLSYSVGSHQLSTLYIGHRHREQTYLNLHGVILNSKFQSIFQVYSVAFTHNKSFPPF